jgi:hypothetical protein
MAHTDMLTFTEVVSVGSPSDLIRWYLRNVSRGPDYYEPREPETGYNELRFGDLAWAVLLEGQPRSIAAQSLLKIVPYDISAIPIDPLEQLNEDDIAKIAAVIDHLVRNCDGIRAAIATKMLHPKRRATVPVCDNKAIFGSFLRPTWRPHDPVGGRGTVLAALTAIHHCLTRPENETAWHSLHDTFPRYTRIELFDMAWWTVLRAGPALAATDYHFELSADIRQPSS